MHVFQRERKQSLAEQMSFLLNAVAQASKNSSERSLTAFRAPKLVHPQNSAQPVLACPTASDLPIPKKMSHLVVRKSPCDTYIKEGTRHICKMTPPILTGGVQDYVRHAGRVLGGAHGVLPMEGVARPTGRLQWNI